MITTRNYFSDILCVAISEIAYYRYMFPEAYFEDVRFELVPSHLLAKGKSLESDQLLEFMKGMCDAVSKGYAKMLVLGISAHPAKPAYIRELYAFQFHFGNDHKTAKSKRQGALDATTRLLLRRLPLKGPTSISARMTLRPVAPSTYAPPSFMSFSTVDVGSYTIMPQCGSAKIGKADNGDSTMYMCVLCAEGHVADTPLGSTTCTTPMPLDVDEDPHERVLVASPGWINSRQRSIVTRQMLSSTTGAVVPRPRQIKAASDDGSTSGPQSTDNLWCECGTSLDSDAKAERTTCITCRLSSAGISVKPMNVKRLALARRTVSLLQHHLSGSVAWLVKKIGCKNSRGRRAVEHLRDLGLVEIDHSVRPYSFNIAAGDRRAAAESLFSDDIHVVWAQSKL
ncbi:hypothetical protein GQ54DRAFT_331136 [Martensiomyces pterosporus]|nr:hypothetical protein GQ54DRAFT_331136 [Martensiomyces pterosporus]